jgi:hypothetical protein
VLGLAGARGPRPVRAALVLAVGQGSSPWLWYAIIIDILRLASQCDQPELRLLREEIVTDAPAWAWEQFPRSWKHLLAESLAGKAGSAEH